MTAAESVLGKYRALRTLASIVAWFDNWDEIWRCYRRGAELPPLRFRRGFILRHRPEDQVLLQFYEVFRDKNYRRYIAEHRRRTIVDIGANIGVFALALVGTQKNPAIAATKTPASTQPAYWSMTIMQ